MSSVKKGMLLIGVLTILASNLFHFFMEKSIVPSDTALQEVLPTVHFFEKESAPLPHYKGFLTDKKNTLAGVVFLTTTTEKRVKGYTDEIALLVGMNGTGKIIGVKLLDHKETPSYMNSLLESTFIEDFTGQESKRNFSGIDTVSGATISSQAIINDIYTGAVQVAQTILKIKTEGLKIPSYTSYFLTKRVLFFTFILSLAVVSYLLPRYNWLRTSCLLLSAGGPGFFFNTFLYLGNIVSLFAANFPPSSNPNLFILIIFIFITTVFFGPLFCSHLCPFGSIQEFLYKISPYKWHISQGLWKKCSSIKYLLLFLCVIMIFGFQEDSFSSVEPFTYLFSWTKGAKIGTMWIYIGGVLFISSFFNRFYCRIFCPTGACLTLLSQINPHGGSPSPE